MHAVSGSLLNLLFVFFRAAKKFNNVLWAVVCVKYCYSEFLIHFITTFQAFQKIVLEPTITLI